MARPMSYMDLAIADQRGDEVARWNSYTVMSRPSVAKHLVAAAEAAEKAGLIVDSDGIYFRPSVEVLDDRLFRVQERWDQLSAKYEVAKDFVSPNSELWEINNWANQNGLPRIKPIES